MYQYDLIVIGGGSGGVRAARRAAEQGIKVAIIEARHWGGTCVNVGCVPKKLLVYSAQLGTLLHQAKGFGWQVSAEFRWQELITTVTNEVNRLSNLYRNRLQQLNVTCYHGQGRLQDPHTVTIDNETITAKTILLATGGQPFIPKVAGRDLCVNSDAIFQLSQCPKNIVIVGGGYIAVEFASIFHGLGVNTHLIYRGDQLLRHFDPEVSKLFTQEITNSGIQLHLNATIQKIESTHDHSNPLKIDFISHQNSANSIHTDLVLMATGRKALTEGLGLTNVNLATDEQGQIPVNENFQTQVDSIYAIGDLVGFKALTPVAIAEAEYVINHLYTSQNKQQQIDYQKIATAVFAHPNVATVGLTEPQAKQNFPNIKIFKQQFKPLRHALSQQEPLAFVKLIVNAANDLVLGAHLIGAEAGEIIQGIAIAMQAGITKKQFDDTIGVHPTLAEEFVTLA